MPTLERGEITPITRLRAQAQDAMKEMAARLIALADRTGDLAIESRRILILCKVPPVAQSQVDEALRIVGDVANFVDNWSDCARHRKRTPKEQSDAFGNAAVLARDLHAILAPTNAGACKIMLCASEYLEEHRGRLYEQEEPERDRREREFDEKFLAPAIKATAAAVEALCALTDARCSGEA